VCVGTFIIPLHLTFLPSSFYLSLFTSNYARGDREVGNHYELVNFDAAAYDSNPASAHVLGRIGTWTVEDGYSACELGGSDYCISVQYNTADNLPALDTPPRIVINMEAPLRVFLLALAALCFVVTSVFSYFVLRFWSSKVIRAAQPLQLCFILLGAYFGVGRVVAGAVLLTDVVCDLQDWLGHLSFGLVFGSLLLKTWRVNKIVNTKTLKRVTISQKSLNIMMGVFLSVFGSYLAVMQGIGGQHHLYISTTVSNQETAYSHCGLRITHMATALYVAEAVMLVYGVRLCWATKDVPDVVNESKYIAAGELSTCASYILRASNYT
jgi:hypothetical protein